MKNRDSVIQVIFAAVDSFNQTLPPDRALAKEESTSLLGGEESLDSLEIINFISAVEKEIKAQWGFSLKLFDLKAMAQAKNPFQTIGSLADFNLARVEARPPS